MDAALVQHLKSKQKREERNSKQYKFAVAQDSKEGKDLIKKLLINVWVPWQCDLENITPLEYKTN